MTKTEALRRARLDSYLLTLGFTDSEVASLRRINSTLQRWHEMECGTDNGAIERDDATDKPYWVSHGLTYSRRTPVADRETGALRRLARIVATRNARITDNRSADAERYIHATCAAKLSGIVSTYIQTDPRGAALYILRPGDVPEGYSVESCYTRGVCVF